MHGFLLGATVEAAVWIPVNSHFCAELTCSHRWVDWPTPCYHEPLQELARLASWRVCLRLIGQVCAQKSPPPPLLISSLALKHVLNFKSSLSWAPIHDAACRMSARAGVTLPDVLLGSTRAPWEVCSELCPQDVLLCSELDPRMTLLMSKYVIATYMSFLLVFLPSRLQRWYPQQHWPQVRGLALLPCNTAHATLACRRL